MEKNYFNGSTAQCIALDLNEMMAIDGGGAYEVGHAIGSAIHDFCAGVWDGLCGK